MHADVRGFRRRIGERDRLIERDVRLLAAAKLQQQPPLSPKK